LNRHPKPTKGKGTVIKEAEKQQFLCWLSLPEKERNPRTQQAFARQISVNPATLSIWKDDPKFLERVRERVDERCAKYHPDVVAGLIARARKGYAPEVKLFFQYAYGWAEKQKHEVEDATAGTSLRDLSEEQLDQLTVECAKEIAARGTVAAKADLLGAKSN